MPRYHRRSALRPSASRAARISPRRWLVVALGVGAAVMLVAGGRLAFAANNGNNAAPNPNCDLIVPADPLSAQGLATPYELVARNARQGACHEANTAQAAFVQGTVVDPATGQVSVYNPLVVDRGQKPAAAPVVPKLPQGAVVGLWFGFNGTNLTLRDTNGSLKAGNCVNGLGNSIFGQFAYCNAPAFFQTVNSAIAAGKLAVPPLGTGKDGNPCPTTRDFSVIDQDQSDNVTSTYLIVGNSAAQNTAANRAQLRGKGKVQVNGSDNLLVDAFIDKALGCTPFQAPDLADNGAPTTALALNELQAAADQRGQVALVPPNDPMALAGNRTSVQKTNLYRAGVDQPAINNAGTLARTYCQDMNNIQQQRLQQDRNLDSRVTSPDRAAANNLFTFLAQRLNASFTNLGCQKLLNTNNPVKLTLKNGIAVNATFAQAARPQPDNSNAGNGGRNASRNGGPNGKRGRNNTGNGSGSDNGNSNVGPAASGSPADNADATAPPDVQPDPDKAGDGSLPQPSKY